MKHVSHRCSTGQRVVEGSSVVAAAVHDTVDEQRRCAEHLTRRRAALDVPTDSREGARVGPVAGEACDVEPELGGVPLQIIVLQCVLATEEQPVHVPEPVLERRRLGCGRCGERVRVDLREREMAEGEADAPAPLLLDAFDLEKRPPRIRTLVIAVLEDEGTIGGATDVIDRIIEWLDAPLAGCAHRDPPRRASSAFLARSTQGVKPAAASMRIAAS